MDVKEKVEEIAAKLQKDPSLLKDFQSEPVKTVEKLAGVDIPDGMEEKLAAGVKTALAGDKAAGILGAVKKLI